MKPINSNTDQQNEQQQPAKETAAKANPDIRDITIPVLAADVAEIRDFAGVTRRLAALRPADHVFFANSKDKGAATTDLYVSRGTLLGWRAAEVGIIGKVGAISIDTYVNKVRVKTVPPPARAAEAMTPVDLVAMPDGSVNSRGELRVTLYEGSETAEPCVQIEVSGRRYGAAASGIGFWLHPSTVYAAAAMLDAHPEIHQARITVWWHHSDDNAAPTAASQPESNASLLKAALA